MEIYVKYYYLHFELNITLCKFAYISMFEVVMAGRYKVTTNSIRNLIIHHFKNGKSIRTIRKLVKVIYSTVFPIIKRWKLCRTVENALK